jgi:2-oxoglutarate dehydrogenase E1 component
MQKFTYLKSANADYIDELYARYAADPASVDPTWRYFFEGLELGSDGAALPNGHAEPANGQAATVTPLLPAGTDLGAEARVAELIAAYRENGKHLARVNPLAPAPASHPLLELARFGLTDADLGRSFQAGKMVGLGNAKLADILARLRQLYCGTVGAELAHVGDPDERRWLVEKFEQGHGAPDAPTRKHILRRITEAETFERFLHTRYVAQKRFSVEGGESVIPALDCMIEAGAEAGATDFVVGMAHRGRLNVLTHVFGKKPEYIFTEFEGTYNTDQLPGEGDVKYHMGYSADVTTRTGKKAHLSLGFNPSHLEFINPVIEGQARAKQRRLSQGGDDAREKVIAVQIHGDAAFAGQGVCYETLQLSRLPGYATGGTLHIVINNQVGFTTDPKDARSTQYCTDMAKMLEVPVFHVNGDDPDAVWRVSRLLVEYRARFRKDAVLDLVCYRKHGHNEGDEPAYTQPLMYKAIKAHPSPREAYAAALAGDGTVAPDQAQALVDEINGVLIAAQARAKAENPQPFISTFEATWKAYRRPSRDDLFVPAVTAVAERRLRELAEKINHLPEGFTLHPKLARFFEARLKAVKEGTGIDWGNGEALAFASLLAEGHDVRLTGQDAERGTFSHRHSVLNDFQTGETCVPLNRIGGKQGRYQVHNSNLSETAVMGFEYGYSMADPSALVIWEAQFGDFANGAQVIIDQFLASSESKWQRMSGLTLLLPHGYEGQGPEHSSARLERFLQLCGRENMAVCNLTTPAQLFHALRRQVKRDFRKPLVVMSPKSMLRHPQAVSRLEELSEGAFQEVIDDPEFAPDAKTEWARKILLCSGKVYYDLVAERAARKVADVAIVRVEQLYPFPERRLAAALARYPKAQGFCWVQEEPRNMGAWTHVFNLWNGGTGDFAKLVGGRGISYAGREIGASPAVGSPKVHEKQHKALLEAAFRD